MNYASTTVLGAWLSMFGLGRNDDGTNRAFRPMLLRRDYIPCNWGSELDGALPLRELPPCNIITDDDLDFRVA